MSVSTSPSCKLPHLPSQRHVVVHATQACAADSRRLLELELRVTRRLLHRGSFFPEHVALGCCTEADFPPLLQDFRQEILPRGTVTLKDNSKAALIAASPELRNVYKDYKVSTVANE